MENYDKCGTKDRFCDDNDDTYVIVHETLEISVKHVYMMRATHFHKYFPLKQTRTLLCMISDNSHARRQHFLYKDKSVNNT